MERATFEARQLRRAKRDRCVSIGDDETDEAFYPMLPDGSLTVHVNGGVSDPGSK
jgi:hypothetical protein